MSQVASLTHPIPAGEIVYPESDGRPMADNTLQFEWISTIKWGLDWEFRNDPDVFVAGDLLWYPVEGRTDICAAPDTMVVRGRPKGHRGSYQQWIESDTPPQVVFEILSPSNTPMEIIRKLGFYARYGVQEYYIFDPARKEIEGFERSGDALREIPMMNGWVSPCLGVRFRITDAGLELYGRDGDRLKSYFEIAAELERLTAQSRSVERPPA